MYYPNTKAVLSPSRINSYPTEIIVNKDNTAGQVLATDLPDCSNPYYNGIGISIRGETEMTPSMMLGWFGSENIFNLSSIRRVPSGALNYFWNKRPSVVAQAQSIKQSDITLKLQDLKSGAYALTTLQYLPNLDVAGKCSKNSDCQTDLCLHQADYKAWYTFSHYTIQPCTPGELSQYFNILVQ
jgi:hypothetical protein